MRGRPIRVLSARAIAFCFGVLLLGSRALGESTAPAADVASPSLRIDAPTLLVVGAAATIDVLVRLPPGPEQPLLLTPSAEGEAVRVVRGRLLRSDAERTPRGDLRFRVPIVARRAGTAVLRVELLTYRCAPGCTAVQVSASRVLQVSDR
jgi:hypothetical protein